MHSWELLKIAHRRLGIFLKYFKVLSHLFYVLHFRYDSIIIELKIFYEKKKKKIDWIEFSPLMMQVHPTNYILCADNQSSEWIQQSSIIVLMNVLWRFGPDTPNTSKMMTGNRCPKMLSIKQLKFFAARQCWYGRVMSTLCKINERMNWFNLYIACACRRILSFYRFIDWISCTTLIDDTNERLLFSFVDLQN